MARKPFIRPLPPPPPKPKKRALAEDIKLCPLRGMEPCTPQCGWHTDAMCAVKSLNIELYTLVEVLAKAYDGVALQPDEGV